MENPGKSHENPGKSHENPMKITNFYPFLLGELR
jgi:hypothetical protein